MYQISRSIYRELEADIEEGRRWGGGPTNHERVLRACEAAVHRLATDRHYFARPSKTLFNDIRPYFPMSAQLHVFRVVDHYLSFASEYLATRPTAVLAAGGRLFTAKAPTTPGDQSEGVLAAVRTALERAGAGAEEVEAFAHGTTVATNALLEGTGARTVLVATAGFEDVVELGRQARADLYRLCAAHPAPLVPPERRIGAPERMGPDGPERPLGDPPALAREVAALEPGTIDGCLLQAYRHPEHEQALGAALADALPDVHVSLSHEVVGTFREYERAATTEIDAALSPLLGAYLRRLADRAAGAGLPAPSVMQSSGGLAGLEPAAEHAAVAVLSGPAGGAA